LSAIPRKIFAKKPEQLTAEWAQALLTLRKDAPFDASTIQKASIASIDIGTTTRIRLNVEHPIGDALPKRWFVKLPSLSLRARVITALPRLLPTEIRFYNELAPHVPLITPPIIGAHQRTGIGATLVMHDVAELGATPGKAGEALTASQAAAVIEQLAKLHSTYQEMAGQDRGLRWLAGPVRRLEDALGTALAVPLMKRSLRLAGGIIPAELHASALNYAQRRKRIMAVLGTDAPTLLHHDCHPGNLFWQAEKPGFLDWQMVRLGEGVSDVSYFMATALTPKTRRQCEMELLKRYYEQVSGHSKFPLTFERLIERYRLHLAYPFEAMALTLAIGDLMETHANREMLKRAVTAICDHDVLPRLAKRVG
jgi:Phosphotransferase enzyme family